MNLISVLWTLLNGVTLFFWASAAYHGESFLFKIRLAVRFVKRFVVVFISKFLRPSQRIKQQRQVVAHLGHGDGEVLDSRSLYFVRHGESTWNEMVNRGFAPQIIVPKLASGIAFEAFLLSKGMKDSKMVDAPLCDEGTDQANSLRKFLEDESNGDNEDWAVLNGYSNESFIVSSNLRRSLSTVLLGFADRLERQRMQSTGKLGQAGADNGKVLVNPFLQETSLNADCLSIHLPRGNQPPVYNASTFESRDASMLYMQHIGGETQPASQSVLGDEQLLQFAEWVFEFDPPRAAPSPKAARAKAEATTVSSGGDADATADGAASEAADVGDNAEGKCVSEAEAEQDAAATAPALIVGGHSLWFRRFFQVFLPTGEGGVPHDCQKLKIHNGGVVGFTLQKVRAKDGTIVFRVVRESVRNVFREYDRRGKFKGTETATTEGQSAAGGSEKKPAEQTSDVKKKTE